MFSRTLRDWFLLIGSAPCDAGLSILYTEDILAETIYSIRRARPDITGTALTKVRDRIARAMSERIDTYESGYRSEQVGDMNDRHVHAAALGGDADFLVTSDQDFLRLPSSVTDKFPNEIFHPDEFLARISAENPVEVRWAVETQISYRHQSGRSDFDFSAELERAGCPTFAQCVKSCCQQIAREQR